MQKFTLRGSFLNRFGREGTDLARFSVPTGVAVDQWGNIHVADSGNHRVQVFSSAWDLLVHSVLENNQHLELNSPVRVAVQHDYVYLSDWANHRIIQFRMVDLMNQRRSFNWKWERWL